MAESKVPWKNSYHGQIESGFLFCSAISKSILPFLLFNPDLVVLPITIENNATGDKQIKLNSSSQLLDQGFIKAAKWFSDKENIWKILSTEKNRKFTSEKYLNWQNKLTSQNLNSEFLVIYTASAKDANAVVIDRKKIAERKGFENLEFFVESKAYVLYTNNKEEAYYLVSFLNSSVINRRMKDFQTRGLFGPRDIHKKILDIWFPGFDPKNELHLQLAELSRVCHQKAARFVNENPPGQELSALQLGKLRVQIKSGLSQEMESIDLIVKQLTE